MKTLVKIIAAALVITILEAIVGMLTCGGCFSWVYKEEPTNVWKFPMGGQDAGCPDCSFDQAGVAGVPGDACAISDAGTGGDAGAVGSVCSLGRPCGNRKMGNAPPMAFFVGLLVLNLLFVLVYVILSKAIPGGCSLCKGIVYGVLVWLVGVLPGMFMTHMCMTVATSAVIYLTIKGLIMSILKGALAAIICDGKSSCAASVPALAAPPDAPLSAEAKSRETE